MKTLTEILTFSLLLNCIFTPYGLCDNHNNAAYPSVVIQQVRFDPNNTDTWIYNTGIFNIDLRPPNPPGFQWPKGSGHFAIFTSGLTLAAYVNNQLRVASCSYAGELAPGYVTISLGEPVAHTDSRFKIYKVSRGDNMYTNPDWLNWGYMVPYGAPYVDVNSNNIYEPLLDTPGVKDASQTLFVCMTDGFPESHISGEGFGGGTLPLFAEVHLTAWGYDNVVGAEDVQFLKWDIINKNTHPWNRTYFSIFCDPDLGCSEDDYIGCDSVRQLGFCYNSDNDDGGCSYGYGVSPPALGIKWLTCFQNSVHLNSFVPYVSSNIPGFCGPPNAYQIIRGFKNDGSWWLNPKVIQGSRKTKYVFSGDPESNNGWNCSDGIIDNCGGDTTGNIVHPTGVDWRFVMSAGADNFTLNPNDRRTVMIAQFMARGSNNLNSVTKLKLLDNRIQSLCDSGFLIGINNINTTLPNSFYLYQNYPNPFNPVTKIKFQIPSVGARYIVPVKLVIYDVLGREVTTLVNEKLNHGTYVADWDGTNYSSGVYFYKLITGEFIETKKMVLIK